MNKDLFKNELLTQEEVAEYFRVVPGTVKNWRDQRLLSFWQAHCITATKLKMGASRLAPPNKCQQPIIYGYFGQIAYLAIYERFVV